MKRNVFALALALALCLGLSVPAFAAADGNPPTPNFTDVPADSWYAEAVAWAVENGITYGTTATTFSPNKTCTRAQIITMLWRAAGSPESNPWADPWDSYKTQDITPNDYFYKAVIWARYTGNGTEYFKGDLFRPNDPCTRLTAVEFMLGSQGLGGSEAMDAGFSDVDSEAVNWAVAWGVTKGTGETTFSPDKTCTRAQIVTMLYRYSQFNPSVYLTENLYNSTTSYIRHSDDGYDDDCKLVLIYKSGWQPQFEFYFPDYHNKAEWGEKSRWGTLLLSLTGDYFVNNNIGLWIYHYPGYAVVVSSNNIFNGVYFLQPD